MSEYLNYLHFPLSCLYSNCQICCCSYSSYLIHRNPNFQALELKSSELSWIWPFSLIPKQILSSRSQDEYVIFHPSPYIQINPLLSPSWTLSQLPNVSSSCQNLCILSQPWLSSTLILCELPSLKTTSICAKKDSIRPWKANPQIQERHVFTF